jgi:hypothetical protein
MRVMRTSAFASMFTPPVVTVVRDSDVIDTHTLESVHAEFESKHPDHFIVSDIFTMPDGEIADAAVEAERRRDEAVKDREQNMAIRFFWVAQTLAMVHESGTIISDKPAPLTRDELAYIEERVAKHPSYKHQTTIVYDETGAEYRFKDGREIT